MMMVTTMMEDIHYPVGSKWIYKWVIITMIKMTRVDEDRKLMKMMLMEAAQSLE